MTDLLYQEGVNREILSNSLVKSLGKRLGEIVPKAKNKDNEWVNVQISYAQDEANYTLYTTPSIIIFNPTIKKNRALTTNEVVYRDFDYDKLTVKEYHEPIPIKLIFKVHSATRNPDNDLKLSELFIKLEDSISYLDAELVLDSGMYDRFPVVWSDPKDFEGTDISKIREVKGTVYAWLEISEYKEVRLIAPNGIELEHSGFTNTKYDLFNSLAQGIYKTNTEIQAKDSLIGFPLSGTIKIGEDEVKYTGRTKFEFTGVSGITKFHSFDTKVELVDGS